MADLWQRIRARLGAAIGRSGAADQRQPDSSNALLVALLAHVNEGLCVFDRDHRIVCWNPAFLRMRDIAPGLLRAGMTADEMLACAARFRYLQPGSAQVFGRVAQQELVEWQQTTTRIELENGTILRINGRAIDARHFAIMYTDVTDSERSALAYRDAATRLSATLNNVLDGIVTIDDHGIIDSFSTGAEKLLGYRAAEVIGQNVKMLMPDVHAAAHDTYLANYRATHEPHIMRTRREVDARHKDGRLIPVELGVSQMSIGNRMHFTGVLRDVTERRRHEKLQREFIATASHELRTPVTSIIGSLGLLRGGAGGSLPDSAQRLIELAHRNGERLGRLVNDILDLEKADSGQFKLELDVTTLAPLVIEAIDANQAYAERFGVRLEALPPLAELDCLVDRNRLHQVLTNLISNAVKFSSYGSRVEVRLAREEDSAVISVSDHGPGIPAAYRDHLFEKFWQADASDARHGGGTGLGLSIARKLVQHMGGHIEVDSTEGHGATFMVKLPVADGGLRAAVNAAGTQRSSPATSSAQFLPGSPVTPPPGCAPEPHRNRFGTGVR